MNLSVRIMTLITTLFHLMNAAEWNLRYNKKLNRFIKKATLRYPEADLDDTIYNPAPQLDTDTIERLSQVFLD